MSFEIIYLEWLIEVARILIWGIDGIFPDRQPRRQRR